MWSHFVFHKRSDKREKRLTTLAGLVGETSQDMALFFGWKKTLQQW